jgi:hypothetical protein
VNGVDPLGLWGVQFGDTNIGWGQPSIAFGEGNHVTGEVGFVQGLSQGAEDTLYGRDRNLSSDLAVGMTPAGLVHDTIDIGYGVDYLRKGQYLAGSLQMAGGLIGIVPIAGDLIKIPLKRGASALAKETAQQIVQEAVQEGGQKLASEVVEVSTNAVLKVNGSASTNALIRPRINGILPESLDNFSARNWYLDQLDSIPSKIDRSKSIRDQAKQAFDLRNQARRNARNLMADRARAIEYDITDPLRSWQQQIKHSYSKGNRGSAIWEDILDTSSKSRHSVNTRLGLSR